MEHYSLIKGHPNGTLLQHEIQNLNPKNLNVKFNIFLSEITLQSSLAFGSQKIGIEFF